MEKRFSLETFLAGKTFFSVFFPRIFGNSTAWVTWAFYSAIYWHVPGLGFWSVRPFFAAVACPWATLIELALLRKRSLKKRIKSFQEFDPLTVFLYKFCHKFLKFLNWQSNPKNTAKLLGHKIWIATITNMVQHWLISPTFLNCQDVLEKADLDDNCHAVHS